MVEAGAASVSGAEAGPGASDGLEERGTMPDRDLTDAATPRGLPVRLSGHPLSFSRESMRLPNSAFWHVSLGYLCAKNVG
ncbi:hypothetical protein GCM10010505_19430 [Kitasatospora aburaviensis]